MTRKRFVKLLMRLGFDRRNANLFAWYVRDYGSYQALFDDVFSFHYDYMENIKSKSSPMLQAIFSPMYFFKMMENPNFKKRMEPIIYKRLYEQIKQEGAIQDAR